MAEMFLNAAAYEGMMGRWSTRLAPLFAKFAQVVDGNRLLDVGCGTGSLVHALGNMTQQSEIVGIDPAQPFVDYSRIRFAEKRFAFDCGDAMHLPYPDGAFAQSLSLLVFMFIPNPEKAAKEMRRVTRAGGSAAACIWDRDGLEMSSILF
jgi:ubiquinone/menaquinone biosynthesis C-methylase UbiE